MDTDELVGFIASDRSHRSTDLVVIALRGLETLTQDVSTREDVIGAARAMQEVRPDTVSLINILDEFCVRLEVQAQGDLVDAVRQVCDGLAGDMIASQDKVADTMASLIADGDCIFTHSMSSTIKRVFDRISQQGKQVSAIVTESRPAFEGRLLVEYLSWLSVKTTFITDSQIGIFMKEADKVVLGADRLLSNGSAVNKAGSLLVALAADYRNVPVYVCAESFKRGRNDSVNFQEMTPDELELAELPAVTARNVYLEELPSELITKVITDTHEG